MMQDDDDDGGEDEEEDPSEKVSKDKRLTRSSKRLEEHRIV